VTTFPNCFTWISGRPHGRARRVVGFRQHDAPLKPVLRRFNSTGAPKAAREACCLDTKWHGEPPNPVLQSSSSTGARHTRLRPAKPPPVRAQGIVVAQCGTLSVLLYPSSTASPRTRSCKVPVQRGRGTPDPAQRSRPRFVRKGLKAPNGAREPVSVLLGSGSTMRP
jgi:hypothetical protein